MISSPKYGQPSLYLFHPTKQKKIIPFRIILMLTTLFQLTFIRKGVSRPTRSCLSLQECTEHHPWPKGRPSSNDGSALCRRYRLYCLPERCRVDICKWFVQLFLFYVCCFYFHCSIDHGPAPLSFLHQI